MGSIDSAACGSCSLISNMTKNGRRKEIWKGGRNKGRMKESKKVR